MSRNRCGGWRVSVALGETHRACQQGGAAHLQVPHPAPETWRDEVGTLEKHSRPKPASLFFGPTSPGAKAAVLARPFRTRRVTIVLASCGQSNPRVRSRAGSCSLRWCGKAATKYASGSHGNAGRSPWGAFPMGDLNCRRRGRRQDVPAQAGSQHVPETGPAAAGSSHGRVPRRSAASRHPSRLVVGLAFSLGPPPVTPRLAPRR